jgi:hypothetical protein
LLLPEQIFSNIAGGEHSVAKQEWMALKEASKI